MPLTVPFSPLPTAPETRARSYSLSPSSPFCQPPKSLLEPHPSCLTSHPQKYSQNLVTHFTSCLQKIEKKNSGRGGFWTCHKKTVIHLTKGHYFYENRTPPTSSFSTHHRSSGITPPLIPAPSQCLLHLDSHLTSSPLRSLPRRTPQTTLQLTFFGGSASSQIIGYVGLSCYSGEQ